MKTNKTLRDKTIKLFDAQVAVQKLDEVKNIFLKEQSAKVQQQLSEASPEEKKKFGLQLSAIKDTINEVYEEIKIKLNRDLINKKLKASSVIADAGGNLLNRGGRHPLRRACEDVASFFMGLGYELVDGDDVTTDEYNFTRLNMPASHPARSSHDTFYIDGEKLLRTHLTSVSAREMENRSADDDVRICSYGPAYRKDEDDATHSHQFTQFDAIWISEQSTLSNLKYLINELCKFIFETNIDIRMRPSYFPFTEPSYEVDVACIFCRKNGCAICKQTGWIEVLGCGMLNPQVLYQAGFDTNAKGLALGIGIERIVMIKYRIEDIRLFYENDVRFLEQFLKD